MTNRACLYQFASLDGALYLKQLAVHDAVDAAWVSAMRLAHGGQLVQRGDAGLVAEKVFATLHRANTQRRALAGDGRAQHQLDRFVVEDGFPQTRPFLRRDSVW